MGNKSFKQTIISLLKISAKEYAKLTYFLYVFQSDRFNGRKSYIISFDPENFLHLTGVKTKMHALDFYNKCFDGTILEIDFDCDSTKEIKGKVKEKMHYLSQIGEIVVRCDKLEECFSKGKVTCVLAVTQGEFTIGFDGSKILFPKSLMHKNRIDESKAITQFKLDKIKKRK